jgi:hypothetical protein
MLVANGYRGLDCLRLPVIDLKSKVSHLPNGTNN